MCKPASMVLTETEVFWSAKTDSHESIINEFNLREKTGENINILRVEVFPDDDDIFSDPKGWKYRVDQDVFPGWHNDKKDEKRTRNALKDWILARVLVNPNKVEIRDRRIFQKGGSVEARENSSVVAWGNSSVEAWGNSTITKRKYSEATVTVKDDCVVVIDRRGSVPVVQVGTEKDKTND